MTIRLAMTGIGFFVLFALGMEAAKEHVAGHHGIRGAGGYYIAALAVSMCLGVLLT